MLFAVRSGIETAPNYKIRFVLGYIHSFIYFISGGNICLPATSEMRIVCRSSFWLLKIKNAICHQEILPSNLLLNYFYNKLRCG